jgi:mannose-6-phosphate isomerase-like protein (cupin superfamily)
MHPSGHGSASVDRRGRVGPPAGRRSPAGRHVDPAAVARRLHAVVRWPGALDVPERAWRLIAQTDDFDAWLIAWPGGGTVDLHDHGGSRGALHVISGSLVETIPWRDGAGAMTFAQREIQEGVTLAFGAGHVHDVRNESSSHALSLHVYSPPLTSMTYYDCFEGRLVRRESQWGTAHEHDAGLASQADRPALRLVAP